MCINENRLHTTVNTAVKRLLEFMVAFLNVWHIVIDFGRRIMVVGMGNIRV